MKRYTGILIAALLSLGISSGISAQIQPPDLICVKNDTLVWELPVNSCGPFVSYLIYASQDIDGPYTVLTTVTDPDQDLYFHELAGGDTWYYYMESNYDCPGLNPLSSDTLDNRIPAGGPLDYVTVTAGGVEIGWAPSPSPEVFAYVISRNTMAGTTIIDTVFSSTTYLDTEAAPDEAPETYFVVALDRCGNKSLVGDPHNTIFLEETGTDPCEQAIDLTWNPYQNWPGGIARHEILVGVNGAPPEVIGQVGGDQFTYRFDQANDGEEYCFVIRAVRGDDESFFSDSNPVCTSVDVIQPVRALTLANATFGPDGASVNLQWRWTDNAELTSAVLLRSSDGSNFQVIENLDVSPPLSLDNTFQDTGIDPAAGPYFYRIETTDDCGDVFSSTPVGTIFLTAAPRPDQTNQLVWTPLVNENAAGISYEVFRITNTGADLLAIYASGELQHVDPVNVDDPDQTAICYYVEAFFELTYPDGSTERLRSRSNIACAEQVAEMYIPNAFAPEGVNSEFRPLLPFGTPLSYSLIIYDRWGGKVFETEDLGEGWDGSVRGQDMPQGVYLYHLRWTTSEGRELERVGTLNLIR